MTAWPGLLPLLGALMACVVMGVWLWRRGSDLDPLDRVLAALLPAGVLLAAALCLGPVLSAPAVDWNDIRLAPAAALIRGYGLYHMPGDGPMLGHIYGPVSPVVYAPVTLLPTPSSAIRAGVALTLFLYLLPAALLLRSVAGPRQVLAAGCLVLFALYPFQSDVVNGAAFFIHADTPALAFAGLACLPLVDATRRSRSRWLAVSALAVVLSAGTKQVMLPVLFALPAYVWLADGWAACLRYTRLVVVCGLAAAGLVFALNDPAALLYQTLVVPSGHPWRGGDGALALISTARDLFPRVFVATVVIGVYGLFRLWSSPRGRDWRVWARTNVWLVPVFVGLFCVPTSVLGRMKVGGGMGALTYCVYFLVLGALLAVVHAASHDPRGRLSRVAAGLVLVTLTLMTVEVGPQLRGLPGVVADLPNDAEGSAFRFVRDHPQQVYLPYNPLVTLIAEDRAYHTLLPELTQQYSAHLAETTHLDGAGVDDMLLHRHSPADLRYVLVRQDGGTPLTGHVAHADPDDVRRRYFPRFRETETIGPGWAVFSTR